MSKSRRAVLAIVCCLNFVLAAGCGNTESHTSITASAVGQAQAAGADVSVEEALTLWQNAQCVIIDVRTPEEYKEGHVPGAPNIPLDQLQARMPEVPTAQKVLLICRSGRRSTEGTNLLRSKGYDNVYNVSGGMLAWKGPVEK